MFHNRLGEGEIIRKAVKNLIRIPITLHLAISLVTIGVWNFFEPTSKDVSDRELE